MKNMNDLRTITLTITVDEARLIRSVLADMVTMNVVVLQHLTDDIDRTAYVKEREEMNALYKKVAREIEAIVGVMA